MNTIYRILFPTVNNGTQISALLLAARLIFGALMMSHGIQKLNNFEQLSAVFPDPLGVGSNISLMLAIFGELACSIAFMVGFLYRLALIPMIFTMCVAFFVIHGSDPFSVKELPLVYIVIFVLMWISGSGKFSADYFISKKLEK
ncbi:DoxX family protein [Bacteroidales bacterium OttesenSCG-928-I21]|nr:DoxX family protein [Bacteroidales bacterium OttesenSCG-928-I21]